MGALDRTLEVTCFGAVGHRDEAVLTRQEHLDAGGLTAQQINEVLDAFVKVSIPASLRFLWRPQLKDPADEMVLETPVNGAADWLVTFNLRRLAGPARQFGIHVARPCDVWREVRRRSLARYARQSPSFE